MRLIGPGENAASIGIDAVREIINSAHLRPYEGRTRVFIITEADLLTRDAANALLKVLEEPPDDVVLILVGNSAGQSVTDRPLALPDAPLPSPAGGRMSHASCRRSTA